MNLQSKPAAVKLTPTHTSMVSLLLVSDRPAAQQEIQVVPDGLCSDPDPDPQTGPSLPLR